MVSNIDEETKLRREIKTLKTKVRMAELKVSYRARDWEKYRDALPVLREKLNNLEGSPAPHSA